MDMRKLIDDTDFDNLNELSKRWKKDSQVNSLADSQFSQHTDKPNNIFERTANIDKNIFLKQNIPQQSNSQRIQNESNSYDLPKKKRQVMPQIIDEDTEHFRNRLQHLLNTFKTDAVSEFMSMKKCMLQYQKDQIKSDTQKYLTMYEEKHQELLQAKDKLISLSSEVERKTMQIQLMSAHIAKLNERIKITRYLSRPFALLYENKERQKMIKFKITEAAKFDQRRVKIRSLNGWRNIFREARREKQQETNNHRVEMEVSEIVGRFQKEMEMLKEKLAQANRKNQEYQNSKLMVQENLKKAFLRGISSMNMQAMGIFGAGNQSQDRKSQINQQTENFSYTDHNQMAFSRTNNPMNQTTINAIQNNPSVIINKAKIQSKDHKWREAPILGMEQKQEVEQPRPQLVRPTTQAKVIKVVDGRSAVENISSKQMGKRTPINSMVSNKMETGSRKKI